MIGNDVVDIIQARRESNWQRKGFLEKLFSAEEREIIHNHISPETTVWVLWSMKEAAYKIYNRQTGVRAFMPQRLQCVIRQLSAVNYEGVVLCEGFVFYTVTQICGSGIHTVAVCNPEDTISPVNSMKNAVLKDDRGLPYILKGRVKVPVSVSHHGKYYKVVRTKSKISY